jgi:hypothetical protein
MCVTSCVRPSRRDPPPGDQEGLIRSGPRAWHHPQTGKIEIPLRTLFKARVFDALRYQFALLAYALAIASLPTSL